MAKKTILFLWLMLSAVLHTHADELISSICIADGVEYDCDRPVFTETGFTFKTVDPEIKGQWELYQADLQMYVNEDTFLTMTDNGEFENSFFFDINTVDWNRFRRDYFTHKNVENPEEEYNERGYYIYVKFTAQDGRSDTRVFMYAVPTVIPPRPVITNAYFEVENYNFEEDSMWYECDPQSSFIVEVYSENATRMFAEIYEPCSADHYFTVDDWRNETYSSGCIITELPEVINGHGVYRHEHAEWDDLLLFYGVNSDGTSFGSEPVLLGDYITDPAIRARIDELHNQVGITSHVVKRLQLAHDGDAVTATAGDGGTTVTLEVVGIDGAKRAAVSGHGTATADLSTLAPGVYVVRASDGHEVKTLKVMIND